MRQLAIFLSVVQCVFPASLLKRNFVQLYRLIMMKVTIAMAKGIQAFEVLVTLFVVLLAMVCQCRNVFSSRSPRVVIEYFVYVVNAVHLARFYFKHKAVIVSFPLLIWFTCVTLLRSSLLLARIVSTDCLRFWQPLTGYFSTFHHS